ncbi:MAG: DNA repair protein RadA [Bacteroidales bacterium]|nr:DNA repair protein RadA [Bacteroidales bacterium]
MAKKSKYVCSSCGSNSATWLGKCPVCGEWNTYEEEIITTGKGSINVPKLKETKPVKIKDISTKTEVRLDSKNAELNRVLGGGIIPGSLTLLGGEPGIGKSTLALQVALDLDVGVLYVSGEESLQQIKLRANRINKNAENCFIHAEILLENIIQTIDNIKPELVVIDSIQTIQTEKLESTPGTVSQVRECTTIIQRYAKQTDIPFIIIGHINKEGSIAGPKILEHIVDTVLQFEGDRNFMYRILRGIKNRFGSTSEIGIFEMKSDGLREVNNPSELLMSQGNDNVSGVTISATLEGVRPLLIEIQALVSSAVYGTPQRSSTTFDLRRLNMLLAVLEKRAGFRLSTKDVFLNIAGGIKIIDTAMDLSVIASILSSDLDIAIPKNVCFAGEIGLSGEVRPVSRIEQRISEAQKLGIIEIYISKFTKNIDFSRFNIKITQVGKVEEVFRNLFGRK